MRIRWNCSSVMRAMITPSSIWCCSPIAEVCLVGMWVCAGRRQRVGTTMYKSDALPPEAEGARRIEGVRLRNALLLQPSTAADFDWTPAHVPRGFAIERRAPTPLFRQVVDCLDIGALSDWDKARALSAHLTERAQDKGPIQSDLATTYRGIREGYGHCADFAKVYLALAHAAGVFVRQWAFTHNGFGGNGHVLTEVWD